MQENKQVNFKTLKVNNAQKIAKGRKKRFGN